MNAEFHIQTGAIDIRDKEFNHEVRITQERILTCSKGKGSEELALTVERAKERKIDPILAEKYWQR